MSSPATNNPRRRAAAAAAVGFVGARAAGGIGLYAHLPWCLRKCPYCDFNSHRAPRALPQTEYIDALTRDIESALPDIWGRRVSTVYLGGGTPSLFAPAAIDLLLSRIRALLPLAPDAEITIEANPGAADAERFAGFAEAGINRVSLGAQTFDDDALRVLGRAHDAAAARRAARAAVESFPRVNIDLMHGLPGQSPAAAARDIDIAAEFEPEHLSLYQLTLEPGTPFFRAPPPAMPGHDSAAAVADAALAAAQKHGYERYEVSAFARAPAARCRHNLHYWRFGDYLGVGAGAHGKLTIDGRIWRDERIKNPAAYMRAAGGAKAATRRAVAPREAAFEFFLNALRLPEGFAVADFLPRAGVSLAALEKPLAEAERRGLIERDAFRVRPTEIGIRFLNETLELFLPADGADDKSSAIIRACKAA